MVGNASLLAAVVIFVFVAWLRGVRVYDTFLKGGSKGFSLAVDLIPYLVGILQAITLLRTSGAFGMLQQVLAWFCGAVGVDARWSLALPQGAMKAFQAAPAQ